MSTTAEKVKETLALGFPEATGATKWAELHEVFTVQAAEFLSASVSEANIESAKAYASLALAASIRLHVEVG